MTSSSPQKVSQTDRPALPGYLPSSSQRPTPIPRAEALTLAAVKPEGSASANPVADPARKEELERQIVNINKAN